ncbi:MAG: alpha/beta hydrolase, partial [Pseudomonadota bacterium]|nr:alpha/beta hydrolase [Pseudomonadota bacterium]
SQDTIGATLKLTLPLAAPIGDDIAVVRDVQYGSDARQRLNVFTPASGFVPSRPVLIFVHGGGFVGGDKQIPGTPFYDNIGQWAVRNGYNAVTLTYRLAPQHQWPSGVEDLHEAIRFIAEQGTQYGISPNKVFLMGQSAGASHAASYLAHPQLYAPHGHGLRGVILLSGVYDYAMKPGPMEAAYLGKDQRLYAERSPLYGLLRSDVPLLVTMAECDPPFFEQQGLALLAALHRRKGQLPRCVHMIGQNHFSVAQYLGLDGDLLAPQLRSFIDDYSR